MTKLTKDREVYIKEHELEAFSSIKLHLWLLFRTTYSIVLLFRLSSSENKLTRILFAPLYKLARLISGVQIRRRTKIGGGLFLPHFGTIVLNEGAQYGDYLTLFHGVTVGAKGSSSGQRGLPEIGNNVTLSTNAIVLGEVKIGDGAVIGAGAVVVKDIPESGIAVGNPARVL